MTTAVHGKAALAEMLLDDGAAVGKSGDEDQDRIDAVDFGTTLMSLVAPAATKNPSPKPSTGSTTSAGSRASGKSNADSAASSVASDLDDAPSAFDTRSNPSGYYFSTSMKTPAHSADAQASTSQAGNSAGRPLSDRIAALFASNSTDTVSAPVNLGDTRSDASGKTPTQTHASGPSQAESSIVANIYTAHVALATTKAPIAPVTTNVQPASATTDAQSASAATNVSPALLANADSPVPDRNIAFDFRKQAFPPAGKDESPTAPSVQFSNQLTVTDLEQSAATPSTADATASLPTDSGNPSASSTQNGTSPAVSSQSSNSQSSNSNQDSMQTSDSTSTPATVTKISVDAATSGEQRLTQQRTDGVAQVAPQAQRTRTEGVEDTSPQVKTVPTLATDSASDAASQPAAHAPEAAAIRQVTDPAPTQSSRSVSITVQLAQGQTAQANVREHAGGGIDVKIVTTNASSAQRVSSEIDGMRQNLDAAGIRLGNSEVSYQRGDGSGQGREQDRPQPQNLSSNAKEVFVINEVNQ